MFHAPPQPKNTDCCRYMEVATLEGAAFISLRVA